MINKVNTPINVILADNNPLVLSAMSDIFERDSRFSLVATAATAEGFLGIAMRVSVDIGVIDWKLPLIGGAKLIEIIREQTPAPRIFVYGDDTVEMSQLAMTSGAAGFAPRSSDIDMLLNTCEQIAEGKMVFPFLDIRELQRDPIQQLSGREKTILEALSKGLTNRELATELDISVNTVKFHLSNVFDKISVRNRAQAIAFYYSSRLSGGGDPGPSGA